MKTRQAALLFMALASSGASGIAFGQAFSISPDQLKWSKSVASPSDTTVVHGDPRQGGPWIVRARLQPGAKVLPHSHPIDVQLTVLSGTLLFAEGESFDESKLKEFPAGSFLIESANKPHFQMPKGNAPVVFQASGNGQQAFKYVDPKHDPRTK